MRRPVATSVALFAAASVVAAPLFAQQGPGKGNRGSRRPVSSSEAATVSGSGLDDRVGMKPGGGLYFFDPNARGRASEVRIRDVFWGRLVDVHQLGPGGTVDPAPVFRDLVINELIQSDGVDYQLRTNPVTQKEQLVVLRRLGRDSDRRGAFFDLVLRATSAIPPVLPKGCGAPPPFSLLARNATLVVRFDDLLDDGPAATAALLENVRIAVGYPPDVPFAARVVFDPNHGAVAGRAFHSTRVLIDMTVSALEAASLPAPTPLNAIGLPASRPSSNLANVKLRIPTRVDFGSGQFTILTNLSGAPLATTNNGPIDPTSPTVDVVRAMRSGNATDVNQGFLLDLAAPTLVSEWPVAVESAQPAMHGRPGRDFVVDLRFASTCRDEPAGGDVVTLGATLVEVVEEGAAWDPSTGLASQVPVSVLTPGPVRPPSLLGAGVFHTPFDAGSPAPDACWVSFRPGPASPPAAGVDPSARVGARFSEPMDPATARPFDAFRLVRGDATVVPDATTLVVGTIAPTADQTRWSFAPLLPLAHATGVAETYTVQLATDDDAARDLAGNRLGPAPLPIEFTLDPDAAAATNGGFALRFADPDEVRIGPAAGVPDLRGQFFYDLSRGVILPRPVVRFSADVDRSQRIPSLMVPFPPGTQEPLNPLGSKLQTVWRYADLGWSVFDETKYNLDVEGLSWSPRSGQVAADFFPEFEILLAHASRLPDEVLNSFLLPKYPSSGLLGAPSPFSANALADPVGPQKVVHPRSLGYAIDPAALFVSGTGTPLLPFPLNEGSAPPVTYTWRDTAVLSEAGPDGAGVPTEIELLAGVDPGPPGRVAGTGEVPSFGLPLLVEYRCFPSATALGLNALDISLAINSSTRPYFRVRSSGGVGTSGQVIAKNPDLEPVPTGGFNPVSNPPGKATPTADNVFHIGQVEFVVRVSRVHTIFLDTQTGAPTFVGPVVGGDVPPGTRVVFDYRSASGFSSAAGNQPFNARQLDPYGDPTAGPAIFPGGDPTWSGDVTDADGARYLQVRFSFLNDPAGGRNAELDTFGVAFSETAGVGLSGTARRAR